MVIRSSRKTLGPHFSEAARQVWLRLKAQQRTSLDLARAVGTDKATVWRILYGDQKAGRALSAKFTKELGIEPELWDQKPERPFTPPVAQKKAA